ncbi:MAG: MBOAT family protein [Phycisphaerae bacterium]|nr:MBOAT family protein [Phycisphaerae bacterium]
MIFSSWQFAFFFWPVFGLYWALPTLRARHLLLLVASYVFYMAWNPWLVSLLIASTVIDYAAGIGMDAATDRGRRKLLLVLSLVSNLGMLAVFKYADFFVSSLESLLASMGLPANRSTLSIILPVGISFYTFQTLSYTIDIYRREIRATRSFVEFALFVAFFPQLVAGPIVKAREFLPQLQSMKRFEWPRIESGIVLFLFGLTKKLLIADHLATFVDPVFSDPMRFRTGDLWLAMFCYGGQIYCDFSGYTDMAIAIARMMGYDFAPNFASPYLSVNLSEFWRRWHISLSSWLRDYLYIPLGGSRLGRWITARNLLITMLLGGLWHGASWTFVIWGGIHGVALILMRVFTSRTQSAPGPGRRLFNWAATLMIVHIAWVYFRCQPMTLADGLGRESTAAALNRAWYFMRHLFIPAEVPDPIWLMNKLPSVMLLGLLAILHCYEEWVRRDRPRLRLPAPVAGFGYATWIILLVIFSPANSHPFIYFQF